MCVYGHPTYPNFLFTVTCQKNLGSVGRDNFFFFFLLSTKPEIVVPGSGIQFRDLFLLFNQQQCFIYSTASCLSKLRAKKVEKLRILVIKQLQQMTAYRKYRK
jgi:hypothetical protein